MDVKIRRAMVVSKKKAPSRKVVKATVYTYTVLFEPAAEGGYTVTVPMLPGVITEGDTLTEARERVKEAIRGYLKVLRKHREPIPKERKAEFERPITERVAVTV
jgi:predicted RNase H-like HicB family nuclease